MHLSTSKSLVAVLIALSAAACTQATTGVTPTPTPAPATDAAPADDDAGQAPSAASFCASYCEKVHGCDNTLDQDTCAEECTNANAASLPKFRDDVVTSITSCVQASDCKTVLANNAISKCVSEAAASIAPDAKATAACSALAATGTKCHSTFDRAACLVDAKLYNDGALANVDKCAAKACTDVEDCTKAAVGETLGYSSGSQCSAIGPGKAFDSGSPSCDSCMATSCCAESSACASDSDCMSLVECVLGCTTQACANSCGSRYPSAISAANALVTCSNGCSSACQ